VSGITLQSGANVLTVTARDAANNTAIDTLTVNYTPAASDTTPPTVTITGPTSAATYDTASGTLELSGTAGDNVGVTQVSWVSDRGGSGTAAGTASWSVSGITLQSGANVLTVTARDAANNTAIDTLTVNYTPPDTTPPAVTITGPTSAATYETSSGTLELSGTAADNVGVTQVVWISDRGPGGTAAGTASWSVSGITLQSGANVLTVTARDAANNTAIDTLTVNYTPPDTTPPTVTITGPTSAATYETASGTLELSGTAGDNVGVTQVSWVSDRGGSGTAAGTASWSVSGITLQSGANVLTVTARDAANNTAIDTLSVTYTSTSQGPVAAYGFEEGTGVTVLDSSGNSNTGSILGGAVWTTQGRFGRAISFNGTDGRVFINASNSLNLAGAMTLEAWVYPTATQSGWRTILRKEADAYFLNASHSRGSLRPAGGGTLAGTKFFVGAPSNMPANTWSHIALTYDGTTIRLYRNGVEVASAARNGAIQATLSPLWIGGNSPYGDYFRGVIDEVRIYARALTAAEVAADMSAPVARP
jgi:hypothetical protein